MMHRNRLGKVVKALDCHAHAASQNGDSIDRTGFDWALFHVAIGTVTAGTVTFSLEEADDNGAGSPGSWVAVSGSSLTAITTSTDETFKTIAVNLRARKKWIRIVATMVTGPYEASVTALLYGQRQMMDGIPYDGTNADLYVPDLEIGF